MVTCGVLMMEHMKVDRDDDRKSSSGFSTAAGSSVEFAQMRDSWVLVVWIRR